MKQTKEVRIMVFGTFDMIHEGHKNFFKQARALAGKAKPYLIVSLARHKNVEKIKGKTPDASERKRLAQIKALPEVDKAVLGALDDHLPHIVKERPDIIALGYDQKAYTHGLRLNLKRAGWLCKVVRLKSYKPRQFKTSIIKAKQSR
jgi:FAD synthetase